ncbi:hypothetical protein E2320_001543 [Naja naja]|nr:hypothetical protein E2320_001543 [Naja naja]
MPQSFAFAAALGLGLRLRGVTEVPRKGGRELLGSFPPPPASAEREDRLLFRGPGLLFFHSSTARCSLRSMKAAATACPFKVERAHMVPGGSSARSQHVGEPLQHREMCE